jgi:probable addiction module antidote protein
MTATLTKFDPAEYLQDEESQAFILADAAASGDPQYLAHALGTIARARGMTQVAKDAGVTREALYKSLSADGDPRLSTLLGVMKALNLTMSIHPAKP